MKRPTIARAALVLLIAGGGAGIAATRSTNQVTEQVNQTQAADRDLQPEPLPVLATSAPLVIATDWINTDALDQSDMMDHVVLYEFWTFGCFNCRNVLPHIRAWHNRYAKDGLVVLSIHTPEFDYEADRSEVKRFVDENAVRYPVALDPDRTIWHAFDNHYWPAVYLHDRLGQRRLTNIGEGNYEAVERAIRTLLGVAPDSPWAEVAE